MSRGGPSVPFTVLDLTDDHPQTDRTGAMSPGLGVVVGVACGSWPTEIPDAVDVVLTDTTAGGREAVTVADIDVEVETLREAVTAHPIAAGAFVVLLRQTELLPVPLGLAAESAVYSTLLAGTDFASWRAARPARDVPSTDDAVLLDRVGDLLRVTLNRPERRNAFGTAVRDGLVEALDLALLDHTITAIELRGRGAAFCSGGDLDEFGTAPDPATAHAIRLDRSVAARVYACRDRVTAFLHGACIGAGIEVPAFADRVVAAPGTVIRLPEIAMGLVPGAGGAVSVTARVGRHRTAYLALSGASLGVGEAMDWGLVDEIDD